MNKKLEMEIRVEFMNAIYEGEQIQYRDQNLRLNKRLNDVSGFIKFFQYLAGSAETGLFEIDVQNRWRIPYATFQGSFEKIKDFIKSGNPHYAFIVKNSEEENAPIVVIDLNALERR